MDIQSNFSDININHQFSWYRGDDLYSNMSDDIFIYYCKGTKYRAFKIRRGIIGDKQLDYRDDYSLLKGNCGIYFLYGIENTPKGQIINVYVGKAEGRINPQGMDRLVEHVLNDEKAGAKYCNKWDKALFVTIKEDTPAHPDFTSGVIKALESRFIKMFKGIEYTTSIDKNSTVKLVCYNGKFESGSNEPVDNYKTHIHAIIALLCHSGIRIITESCEKKFVGEYTTDEVYARIQEYNRLNGELKNKIQEIESAESKRIEALEQRNSARVIEEEIRLNFFNTYKLYKDKNVITVNNRIYSALDIVNNTKSSMVLTPYQIAYNMVEIVYGGAKLVADKFILNFYCKDGIFITAIMDYIVKTSNSKKEDLRRFIGGQLFAVTPTIECFNITMHNVLTHYVELMQQIDAMWSFDAGNCVLPHITIINNLETLVKTIDGRKFIKDRIEKEFGTVKFDVVIGNPPYNNDIYLDFVTLGDQLASQATCMITPAKWQAKGGEKNEAFRKNIVPRMSDIVYYPNEKDVFDIHILGGLTYFIVDKEQHDTKLVTNISDGKTTTDKISFLDGNIILDVKCACIVSKVLQSPGYSSITKSRDFIPQKSYFCNKQPSEILPDENGHFYLKNQTNFMKISDSYIKHTEEARQYKVYCGYNVNPVPLAHIYEPNEVANRVSCLMGFGSLDKCNSIKSYYETRFIWFLAYIASTGTICTDTFKWVPDPGKFDHIFTDKELYDKYNLTPEEIAIIESVIKERK